MSPWHSALDWMLMPLSGSAEHVISTGISWHARCMVLSWGVLMPVGALVARYFKVSAHQKWPHELDSKGWWHSHRVLQSLGICAMTIGVFLVWGQSPRNTLAASAHAWGGWALVTLGWFQVAAALARGSKGGPTDKGLRGDHYDMTKYRLWFERLHKGLGWLGILAAVAVITLGLKIVDAPRWMALALSAWWFTLAYLSLRWQQNGRCIDTYQAIWGPDPKHPGNRIQPIGWGVRRPLE